MAGIFARHAGAIEKGIARLRELGVLYEKDGATWLRTTDAGDDEDRVVIRSDGRPTYFANDIAYHFEKLQRAGITWLELGSKLSLGP